MLNIIRDNNTADGVEAARPVLWLQVHGHVQRTRILLPLALLHLRVRVDGVWREDVGERCQPRSSPIQAAKARSTRQRLKLFPRTST